MGSKHKNRFSLAVKDQLVQRSINDQVSKRLKRIETRIPDQLEHRELRRLLARTLAVRQLEALLQPQEVVQHTDQLVAQLVLQLVRQHRFNAGLAEMHIRTPNASQRDIWSRVNRTRSRVNLRSVSATATSFKSIRDVSKQWLVKTTKHKTFSYGSKRLFFLKFELFLNRNLSI